MKVHKLMPLSVTPVRRVWRFFHPRSERLTLLAAAALFTLAAPFVSHAAYPGDLDLTFGSGGMVTTDFNSSSDLGNDVAMQTDGKIVVVGSSQNDFALARYNANGTLDTSFGLGGKVTTDFFGSTDSANDVVIQADGKIVVAGVAGASNAADFALARYNTDGTLDTSFGLGGKVTTDFFGRVDRGRSMAVQADGKIIVAGYVSVGGTDFALARYNTNGTLDTSFGLGGKVTTDIDGSDNGMSVALQADGKILVAGIASVGGTTDFALARYNTNGTLDTSFATGGKTTIDWVTGGFYSNDQATSVLVQADGKIVVVGRSLEEGSYFALARYKANGTLDTSYGGGSGMVRTAINTSSSMFVSKAAVQADGKIVVSGVIYDGGSQVVVVRYDTRGVLDASFGENGAVFTSVNGSINQVEVQADGRILAVGNVPNGGANDFTLIRYEGTAIRSGFNADELPANDDGFTYEVPLGFSISLFGQTYSECFVNNNGNITFEYALDEYTPEPLQTVEFPIIAAFWADVDTRSPGSDSVRYGTGVVNGRNAFGVNYNNVGYYALHDDKLNSFQLLLIDRSDTGTGNFDVEFNYGQVRWETGDYSQGTNGYGGSAGRVGITNGSDRTIELTNSGKSEAFLDTDLITGEPNYASGLVYQTRNSTIPGRFIFQVRGGQVLGALKVNAGPDQELFAQQPTATLAGVAQDPNPNGGAVTVTWTVLDGPAGLTISNPHSLTPTITFPGSGSYVLQLTATSVADPQISAADTVAITRY